MLKIIDISHHQGTVDFAKVKSAGVAGVILKATEGAAYVDPAFHANRKAAHDAGLIVGSYHFYRFFSAGNTVDWGAQLSHYLHVLENILPGELPPALDVEDEFVKKLPGNGAEKAQTACRKIQAFLEGLHTHAGLTPILYCQKWYFDEYLRDNLAKYPLWIADPGTTPPQLPQWWKKFFLWQANQHGRVHGVAGDVDINLFEGDLAAFKKFTLPATV